MKPAVFSRRLHFIAGVESHTWYACADHAHRLQDPKKTPMCFYMTDTEPLRPVSADEDIACDFCREG